MTEVDARIPNEKMPTIKKEVTDPAYEFNLQYNEDKTLRKFSCSSTDSSASDYNFEQQFISNIIHNQHKEVLLDGDVMKQNISSPAAAEVQLRLVINCNTFFSLRG
jgi:hypothetical protein